MYEWTMPRAIPMPTFEHPISLSQEFCPFWCVASHNMPDLAGDLIYLIWPKIQFSSISCPFAFKLQHGMDVCGGLVYI